MLKGNLVTLIETAMSDCWYYGEGNADNEDGISISAEWTESKNPGYSVMCITIKENGVVKFSYDDYGTECAN